MELDALFTPEYGFLMKMALAGAVVLIAGFFLRKRPASASRR